MSNETYTLADRNYEDSMKLSQEALDEIEFLNIASTANLKQTISFLEKADNLKSITFENRPDYLVGHPDANKSYKKELEQLDDIFKSKEKLKYVDFFHAFRPSDMEDLSFLRDSGKIEYLQAAFDYDFDSRKLFTIIAEKNPLLAVGGKIPEYRNITIDSAGYDSCSYYVENVINPVHEKHKNFLLNIEAAPLEDLKEYLQDTDKLIAHFELLKAKDQDFKDNEMTPEQLIQSIEQQITEKEAQQEQQAQLRIEEEAKEKQQAAQQAQLKMAEAGNTQTDLLTLISYMPDNTHQLIEADPDLKDCLTEWLDRNATSMHLDENLTEEETQDMRTELALIFTGHGHNSVAEETLDRIFSIVKNNAEYYHKNTDHVVEDLSIKIRETQQQKTNSRHIAEALASGAMQTEKLSPEQLSAITGLVMHHKLSVPDNMITALETAGLTDQSTAALQHNQDLIAKQKGKQVGKQPTEKSHEPAAQRYIGVTG